MTNTSETPNQQASSPGPGIAVFIDYDTVGWITSEQGRDLLYFLQERYGRIFLVRIFGNSHLQEAIFRKLHDLECDIVLVHGNQAEAINALIKDVCDHLASLPAHVALVTARDGLVQLVKEIVVSQRKVVFLGVRNHLGHKATQAVIHSGGDVHVLEKSQQGKLLINGTRVRPKIEDPTGHKGSNHPEALGQARPSQNTPENAVSPTSALATALNGVSQSVAPPAMKPLGHTPGFAMFVDLENISWLRAPGLQALAQYLSDKYGPLRSVAVFANPGLANCFHRGMQRLPFRLIRVDTHLTTVDEVLKCELLNQLPKLPNTVALLTGDADFTDSVAAIGQTGRKPILVASNGSVGSRLCQAVNNWGGQSFLIKPVNDHLAIIPLQANAKRRQSLPLHRSNNGAKGSKVHDQGEPGSGGRPWAGRKDAPKPSGTPQEPVFRGRSPTQRAAQDFRIPPPPSLGHSDSIQKPHTASQGLLQRLWGIFKRLASRQS